MQTGAFFFLWKVCADVVINCKLCLQQTTYSMATKTLDVYMKLIGMDYLREVLQPHIREIIKSNRDCEIDPMKVEGGDISPKVLEDHVQNLEGMFR